MGQLAPDWWMRGVTRSGRRNAPFRGLSRNASKGGGAKNGAERRGGAPRYKRGGSATREKRERKGSVVRSGVGGTEPEGRVCHQRERVPKREDGEERERESSCSRVPVRGFAGVGAVPRPRWWDGASAISSSLSLSRPRVSMVSSSSHPHRDSAGKPRSFPKPRLRCRAANTCGARHELTDHAGGARSCGHGRRTRCAQREVALLFLWVLCKCVWVVPVL